MIYYDFYLIIRLCDFEGFEKDMSIWSLRKAKEFASLRKG